MFEKFKKIVKDAGDEVEKKVTHKLLEEEVNPTLPLHKGGEVPRSTPGDKKGS